MGWWRPRDRIKPPESPDQQRERRKLELIGGPLVGGFGVVMAVKSISAYHRDGFGAQVKFGPADLPDWWPIDLVFGILLFGAGVWVLWSRLTER